MVLSRSSDFRTASSYFATYTSNRKVKVNLYVVNFSGVNTDCQIIPTFLSYCSSVGEIQCNTL